MDNSVFLDHILLFSIKNYSSHTLAVQHDKLQKPYFAVQHEKLQELHLAVQHKKLQQPLPWHVVPFTKSSILDASQSSEYASFLTFITH